MDLESALIELRASADDEAIPYLTASESAALLDHLGRLHEAVLAADERPEGWSATVAEIAAEIRQLTPRLVTR